MSLEGRVGKLERDAGMRAGVCPKCKNRGEGVRTHYVEFEGEQLNIEHCPMCGNPPPYIKILKMPSRRPEDDLNPKLARF